LEYDCEARKIMFKIKDLNSKFQNLSNKHQAKCCIEANSVSMKNEVKTKESSKTKDKNIGLETYLAKVEGDQPT